MKGSAWIRQVHRWLAIVFTVGVIANFAVMGRGDIALWVGIATLAPLFLLMAAGLCMFALPYVIRRGRAATGPSPTR